MTLRFQTTKILNGATDPIPEQGDFGDLYVKTSVRPDGKRVPTAFFGPKDADGRLGWGEPVLVGEDAFGIERTADPAVIVPQDASANTGTVMTIAGRILSRIAGITGKAWWLAPGITLEALVAHKVRHATGGADAMAPGDIGAIPASQKGTASGVGSLDANGKQPLTEVNAALFGAARRQGTWDASLGTPPATGLANNDTDRGKYWEVSVAGTILLGGKNDWNPGDWIIWEGLDWGWVDNTDRVGSVEGRTGAVTLTDILQARSERGNANGYASLGTDGKVPPAQLPAASAGTDPAKLTTSDVFSDFVVLGLLPSVPSPAGLAVGIPAGSAIVGGLRIEKAAEASRAYAASSDTYVDFGSDGLYSYAVVANGGAEPTPAAGRIRLFKVVTGATAITAIDDRRPRKNEPIELGMVSVDYAVFNNLSISATPLLSPYLPGTNGVPLDADGVILEIEMNSNNAFRIYVGPGDDTAGGVRYSVGVSQPNVWESMGSHWIRLPKSGANAGKVFVKADAALTGFNAYLKGWWR